METVYALESPQGPYYKSIFLAGPTPRDASVQSWRGEALRILDDIGYDGHVFIPEPRDGNWSRDYWDQIEWEERHLEMADVIVFWIPRDMGTMPGLTTNDEWGTYKRSGKCILGAPRGAASVRYQQHYAKVYGSYSFETLDGTLLAAVNRLDEGALRSGPEREVPLAVWQTPSFQQWYLNMCEAGNELLSCRVEYTFRVGPRGEKVFLWIVKPEIFVRDEERVKNNEIVMCRPDTVAVVLHHRDNNGAGEDHVVLVGEFRSTVSNKSGMVWELPGGSAPTIADPRDVAAAEVQEEVGLEIDTERFVLVDDAQVIATFSPHRCTLYSVELSDDEYRIVSSQVGNTFGLQTDGEITWPMVLPMSLLTAKNTTNIEVDWATYGMIMRVMSE